MRKRIFAGSLLLLIQLSGQTPTAQPVEMSVPFGVVTGKLVTSGEHLIFIDDTKPEQSFAMNRQDVQDLRADNGVIAVQLSKPAGGQSGPSRVNFRLLQNAAADPILAWSRKAPGAPATPSAGSGPDRKTTAAATPDSLRYPAKHNHRIGSCDGQLIITPERVVFESVTDVGDSRQWDMRDIKELKRKNPYEIELKPFTGNDYKLQLMGTGMDNNDYKSLVDRITAARAGSR